MPEESTPVLIIGAGAAGLRVAIELAQRGVHCLVVGKRAHGDAHTRWAAGGINAALGSRGPDDRPALHAADTVREGHFVCQPRAVELLARHAPDRIRELEAWGCEFSRTEDGKVDQRYFGAQSRRRTCFAGDRTGEAVLHTLVERARGLDISYRDNLYITRLLRADGRVRGAAGFEMETGRPFVARAHAVVLAAGGCTALYPRSSSRPDENTGDAAALALEAGAALRDMEFVQFHPTGMVSPPEMRGRLVTEAVRGEGGHLLNASGERFMQRYSPEHMELDARDVVARAIDREVRAGRGTEHGGVRLDISHVSAKTIRERLPKMVDRFADIGIDITREPMEVAPTAHYAMGGIRVDFNTGATDVPGLFAVGEATSGVHGANRLGGNSLAETVVFGELTGRHLAESVPPGEHGEPPLADGVIEAHLTELNRLTSGDGEHDPDVLTRELRGILGKHAGIVRSGDGLRDGLDKLSGLRRKAASLGFEGAREGPGFSAACNLRCMVPVAETILRGALLREESRGAHFREDAERLRDDWQRSILYTRTRGELRLETEPIPELSAEIRGALNEAQGVEYGHVE